MRMNQVDLSRLKTELQPILSAAPHMMNNMRGMWDAFFKLPEPTRTLFINGYNDTHIETAFRKIMSA